MIRKNKISGFTLVELMVVIGIVGVLVKMSATSFLIYRSKAAYAVAENTVRNAILAAEGSLVNTDNPPASFSYTTQSTSGGVTDPTMAAFLLNYQIPRNVLFGASYDNTCDNSGCEYFKLEAKHCSGTKFPRYIRYGDGFDIYVEDLPAIGCI